MANNFSGDSNCVALWKFDNNADDGKGGNDLTAVGSPSYDSGDKKEGTYCIDLERGSAQYCTIADGDLDASFPGKNGTSEQSFSICAWLKLESLGTTQGIAGKFVASGDLRSYGIYLSYSGYIYFAIGYNSGASYSYIIFNTACSAGKWYHIGVTYDSSDNGMKIRIWDDDAGALLDDDKEGTTGGDMSPDAAALEIGRYMANNNYTLDGRIDEVVIFNKVLSDDDIDAIRAGTYGAGATEKQSADSGSGTDIKASGNPAATLVKSEIGSGSDVLSQAQAILVGRGSIVISGVLNRLIKIAVGQGTVTPTGALTNFLVKLIALTVYLHSRALTTTLRARSLTVNLFNRALNVLTRGKW